MSKQIAEHRKNETVFQSTYLITSQNSQVVTTNKKNVIRDDHSRNISVFASYVYS